MDFFFIFERLLTVTGTNGNFLFIYVLSFVITVVFTPNLVSHLICLVFMLGYVFIPFVLFLSNVLCNLGGTSVLVLVDRIFPSFVDAFLKALCILDCCISI